MANLLKWLKDRKEEVVAQVNPFDQGRTAHTVRQNITPTPPPQRQQPTPPPQSQFRFPTAPPVSSIPKPTSHFKFADNSITRGLSRAYDQINPVDAGRSWQQTEASNIAAKRSGGAQLRALAGQQTSEDINALYADTERLQRQSIQDFNAGKIDKTQHIKNMQTAANQSSAVQKTTDSSIDTSLPNLASRKIFGQDYTGKEEGGISSKVGRITRPALNIGKFNAITALDDTGDYLQTLAKGSRFEDEAANANDILDVPGKAANFVTGNGWKEWNDPYKQPGNIAEVNKEEDGWLATQIAKYTEMTGQTANFANPYTAYVAMAGTVSKTGQENYDDLIAQGFSEQDAKLRATASGATQALIERWSSKFQAGVGTMFGKNAAKQVVTKTLPKKALGLLLMTQKEGGTEAAEEVLQTITNNVATNKPWNQGVVNAAVEGYKGGVMLSGVFAGGAAIESRTTNPDQAQQQNTAIQEQVGMLEQQKATNPQAAMQIDQQIQQLNQTRAQNNLAIATSLVPEGTALQKITQGISKRITPLNESGAIAGVGAYGYTDASKAGRVFEGVDGKPRFEIDDSTAKMKITDKDLKEWDGSVLDDLGNVLDHPTLFKNYPQLAKTATTVTIDPNKKEGSLNGSFDGEEIYVTAPNLKKAKEVLMHEIQHNIQQEEGFATGGNPDGFANDQELKADNEMLKTELNYINKQLETAKDLGYNDSTLMEGKTVAELKAEKKRFEKSLKETKAGLDNYKTPYENYKSLAGEAEARAVQNRVDMKDSERQNKPFYDSLDVSKDDLIVRNNNDTANSIFDSPAVRELKSTRKRLQTQYDNATSKTTKNQIAKAIKNIELEIRKEQSTSMSITGDADADAAIERDSVRNYLRSKPAVKGDATTGEGAQLPGKGMTQEQKQSLIDKARAKVDPLDSLKQEARKYKSVEEYSAAILERAKKEYGETFTDANAYLEGQQRLAQGGNYAAIADRSDPISQSTKLRTVYRGSPSGKSFHLVHGDFLAPTKSEAAAYGGVVKELQIPENQLVSGGKNSYIYKNKAKAAPEPMSLTDLYNQATSLKDNQSGSVQIPSFVTNLADRIKNSKLTQDDGGSINNKKTAQERIDAKTPRVADDQTIPTVDQLNAKLAKEGKKEFKAKGKIVSVKDSGKDGIDVTFENGETIKNASIPADLAPGRKIAGTETTVKQYQDAQDKLSAAMFRLLDSKDGSRKYNNNTGSSLMWSTGFTSNLVAPEAIAYSKQNNVPLEEGILESIKKAGHLKKDGYGTDPYIDLKNELTKTKPNEEEYTPEYYSDEQMQQMAKDNQEWIKTQDILQKNSKKSNTELSKLTGMTKQEVADYKSEVADATKASAEMNAMFEKNDREADAVAKKKIPGIVKRIKELKETDTSKLSKRALGKLSNDASSLTTELMQTMDDLYGTDKQVKFDGETYYVKGEVKIGKDTYAYLDGEGDADREFVNISALSDVKPTQETPAAKSERLHQEKLAKNNLTQNEYAALYDKEKELERYASRLHQEVGDATQKAVDEAKGKLLSPKVRKELKAMADEWGQALDDHVDALNVIRKIDGLEPITTSRTTQKSSSKTKSPKPPVQDLPSISTRIAESKQQTNQSLQQEALQPQKQQKDQALNTRKAPEKEQVLKTTKTTPAIPAITKGVATPKKSLTNNNNEVVTKANQRQLDSSNSDRPLTEYKAGDRVTTYTSLGEVIGTITQTPDFNFDLRTKGNDFKVKLDKPLETTRGVLTEIKTDGTSFEMVNDNKAKKPTIPKQEVKTPDLLTDQSGTIEAPSESPIIKKLTGKQEVKTPSIKSIQKEIDSLKLAQQNSDTVAGAKSYQKDIDELEASLPTKKQIPTTKKVATPKVRGKTDLKFIETVKESKNTSPDIKTELTSIKAATKSNVSTIRAAARRINKRGLNKSVEQSHDPNVHTLEQQSERLVLIEELQKQNRNGDAVTVVEEFARSARKLGQATQIAAAYNKLTPAGILKLAQREIDKAKKVNPRKYKDLKLDPAKAKELTDKVTKVQRMKEGPEKVKATRDMLDDVDAIVPTPTARKITTLWKAGLLTGVKGGIAGNTVGNTSYQIMRKIADVPSAGLDVALGAFTGTRSRTFTLRGLVPGFGEGLKIGAERMKTGTGADDLSSKYDYKKTQYGDGMLGKAAQAYTDTVFNFYSAADKPFFNAALQNSLEDLVRTEATNRKLTGKARENFIKRNMLEPSDDINTQAVAEAEKAVFQNKNALGAALSGFKQNLARKGGAPGEIASEIIAPFTGVPSAIATAAYDFSLINTAVETVKAIKESNKGTFDQKSQRALTESFGKGLTGTALLGLGYQLVGSGLMTLGYPDDPDERALWDLEKKTPYSIKVGGKWRSLNYTGPVMAIMAIGGETQKIQEAEGGNKLQSLKGGVFGSGKAILSSSPLQGAQGALNAITDPQRYGDSYVNNLAGSVIPTIVKDVSRTTDTKDGKVVEREVNNPWQSIQNRTPWRDKLDPKRDKFGQDITSTSPIGAVIDPFKSSDAQTSPMQRELRRLFEAKEGTSPPKVDAKVSIGGTENRSEITLTDKQLNAYKKQVGDATMTAWDAMMKTDKYKALSDSDKRKALENVAEDINAVEMRKFQADNQIGEYAPGFTGEQKDLEKRQKQMLKDGFNADKYTKASRTGGGTVDIPDGLSKDYTSILEKHADMTDEERDKVAYSQNDYDYNYKVARYESDKLAGKLSKAEDINRKQELVKEQVGKDFTKETREVYNSLSKEEIDGLDDETYRKAVDYGDALVDAGIIKKNKLRTYARGSGRSGSSKKAKKISIDMLKKASVVPNVNINTKSRKMRVAIPKAPSFKYRTPRVATTKLSKAQLPTSRRVNIS